jgi:hypothetical protein
MTILIRTQAQLEALACPRARRGVRRVELALPGYSREVRRLQHQINRNLRARGWAQAGLFPVIGRLAIGVLLWSKPPAPETPLARAVALLTPVALAVVGRQIGRWLAHRRVRAAIASYRSRLGLDALDGDRSTG